MAFSATAKHFWSVVACIDRFRIDLGPPDP